MKKNFIYLLFIFSLITSCSSDDDASISNGPTVPNAVMDTWNLAIIIQNNQTEDNFSCEDDLEYTFNNNGTYVKKEFSTDVNNNCVEATIINGNWEAIENNVMRLTPLSSSIEAETFEVSLLNNGNQLQVVRNPNLTELYNK